MSLGKKTISASDDGNLLEKHKCSRSQDPPIARSGLLCLKDPEVLLQQNFLNAQAASVNFPPFMSHSRNQPRVCMLVQACLIWPGNKVFCFLNLGGPSS